MNRMRLAVFIVLLFGFSNANAAPPGYDAYYGDVNGDGQPDVLLLPRHGIAPLHGDMVVPIALSINGQGYVAYGPLDTSLSLLLITPSRFSTEGLQPVDTYWRDVDGDGQPELLLDMRALSLGALVIDGIQNGLGASVRRVNLLADYEALANGDRLALRDRNRDGRFELVAYRGGTAADSLPESAPATLLANEQAGRAAPQSITEQGGDGSAPVTTVVGASEAHFSVGNGQVQYVIPIRIAPGGAGIAPKVSLNYSSSASYGHAGMGFSISGMSAIQRCGRTFERDGQVIGVKGDASDFACLGGGRLALTSGSYWQSGSTYATESESYARIEYHGGAAGGYFEVYQKNGDIFRYGGTTETRIAGGVGNGAIAKWALDSVRDRLGYGYKIHYLAGSGASFPDSIEYTVNIPANGSGYAEVKFYYADDDYQKTYALFGQKYATGKKLVQIASRVDGATLRNYFFDYQKNNITGRSLLNEFTECAGDGTCLMPSEIHWQTGSVPDFMDATYTSFPNTPSSPYMWEEGYPRQSYNRWVDVDRDGRADYCRITPTGNTGSPAEVRCYYSTGSGQFNQSIEINVGLNWVLPENLGPTGEALDATNWNNDPYWQDINSDGFVDFCFSRPLGNKRSSGTDQLTCRLGGADQTRFSTEITADIPRPQKLPYIGQRQWVDINGDGRGDYCLSYIVESDPGNPYVQCQIRDPDQFSFTAGTLLKKVSGSGGYWTDVTGDSLPDYCWEKSNTFNCYINEGGTQLSTNKWTKSGSNFKSTEPANYVYRGQTTKYFAAQFMDFTGNGYADYCRIYKHTEGGETGYRASCLESLGDGWGNDIHSEFLSLDPGQFGETLGEWTQFIDINSDGKIDWCVEKDAELTCFLTDADGFGDTPTTYGMKNIPVSQPGIRGLREYNRAWIDVDGNGIKSYCALFWKRVSPSRERGIACYRSENAEIPDYITGVENGFGLAYDVTYKSITDPSVYDYDLGQGPEGQIYVNAGMQVVAKLETSDGLGGTNEQTYFYRNYGYRPGEIGGLGFEYIKTTSENGNRIGEVWFSQKAQRHQAGSIEKTRTSYRVGGSNRLVSEQLNDWQTVILSGAGFQAQPGLLNVYDRGPGALRYTVQLASSESSRYELDGSLISHTLTDSEYNAYGDLTQQTITVSGANQSFTKKLVNQYDNHPADWILGRLKRSTTTRSGHYGGQTMAPITRTAAWQYYGAASPGLNGMLRKEIIEPDHPGLRKTTEYTYNLFGLKETVTTTAVGAAPKTMTFGYDSRARFVTSETNTLGHTATHQYDALTGNRTSTTDANGLITEWQYDKLGRKTKETAPTGQAVETGIHSCATGCPANAIYYTETKTRSLSGALITPPVKEYKDLLGRTLQTTSVAFDGSLIVSTQQYNARGELVRSSEPYTTGSQIFWNTITGRDVLGRVTEEMTASGVTINTAYAGLTQNQTLSWFDVLDGHLVTRTSSATSDVQGNLRQAVDNDARTILYRYNANGNLTSVHLPDGLVIQNQYDLLGRKTSLTDPNTGQWRYAYNGYDQLVLQQDGNGIRTCNRYDALGRATARVDDFLAASTWAQARSAAIAHCQGGSPTTTWQYDQPAKGLGRLASVGHSGGYHKELFYDTFGRVITSETAYNGETYTASSLYDLDTGRLAQANLPSDQNGPQLAVEYRYNSNGFLYEVGQPGTTDYYWRVAEQTVRGQPLNEFLNNGLIQKSHAYDAASGRLTQIRAKMFAMPGWNIQNEIYQSNASGTLRQRAENIAGSQVQESFDYDNVGRLIEARIDNLNNSALSYSQTVQYDISGNIVARNDVGAYTYAGTCEYQGETYQPGPYAVTSVAGGQSASYCYDAAGNMIAGSGWEVQYTAFNKPSRINDSGNAADLHFWYGPDRELLKQTSQVAGKTVTQLHIGAYEKVTTQQGGTTTIKERYQLPGGAVITFENQDYNNPESAYLFTDSLGSVVAVTSGLGNVTERYRYDPWGRPRIELGWLTMSKTAWSTLSREQGATSKGFTGHEMLDEVGVIHMGGRIYDPALGRFMGADPIIKGITNVESYNRYSYVLNNPLSLTDPTGYSWLGDAFEKLGDSIEKHFREILAVFNPQIAFLEAQGRYGGREVARFAARNQFAGEIIGLVGVAACAFATGGSGAAGCVSSYQGIVSSSMAYGSGEPIGKALAAGARASALAFANASIAGSIGAQSLGPVSSGVLHGIRGGVFAGIMGSDFRSGFTGGFTEGALGRFIGKQGWGADPGSGTVIAGFISGTVSEVTGGKFAVGAFSGAMGYLFREMASSRAQAHDGSSHYSRNAENNKFLKGEGLYGRSDLLLSEVEGAGRFGLKQASPGETKYHRIGNGNENNLKFTSKIATQESWWQRNFSNRYGEYEIVIRPNANGTYTHVMGSINMGTLNRGNNPVTHFLNDMLPYYHYGNVPGG